MTSATATRVYTVPGISCDHCQQAIESQVTPLDGVAAVVVDIHTKTVTVTGGDHDSITAAIETAGYDLA